MYIFFVKVGKFGVSNFHADSYKLPIFATCNLGIHVIQFIIQLQRIPSKYQYKYRYTAILYSYLYSRKPVCHIGQHAHTKLSHSPSFIYKFIDYSSWIVNLLIEVLVCNITVYLLVVCILTRPTGSSKYGPTRKNIQRYYTPKHLIRYIYHCTFLHPGVSINM